MPERPKGADCKSAGTAFGGSNPPRPTTGNRELKGESQTAQPVNDSADLVRRGHLFFGPLFSGGALVQQALHDGHVQPLIEFAANLAFDPHHGEPGFFVESQRPK